MSLLLAKIFFLLVIAALLGAWFERWWLRRQYEDVTSEYGRWDAAWQTWRKTLDERLAALAPVDLTPVHERLMRVEALLRGIEIPKPVAPSPVDLAPLQLRLEALERAVRAIDIPQPVPTPAVDLAPLELRLDAVVRALRAIDALKSASAPAVDLAPLQQQMAEIAAAVAAIHIPPSSPPPAVVPPPPVDLSPVLAKLEVLEARVAPPPRPPNPIVRTGSRNLLHAAIYGAPDDLKRIKGVKKAMEQMLHDAGVYYFWQIAEWTPVDAQHADAQLKAFHGRIQRDNWVPQAGELAQAPDAAPRPADL